MPRMTRSIGTPAPLASYSLSMITGSTSEFILAQMPDGLPARGRGDLGVDQAQQLGAHLAAAR